MFWGRIAQAARQRWQQQPMRAQRLTPSLIAGSLVLVALFTLTRWSWHDGHERVAQAEAPAQSLMPTASPTASSGGHIAVTTPQATPTNRGPRATVTAPVTSTAALTVTGTVTNTALQSPLPTPDIMALISASLNTPISVTVPLPTDGLVPHVGPAPTITPTLAVSATNSVPVTNTAGITLTTGAIVTDSVNPDSVTSAGTVTDTATLTGTEVLTATLAPTATLTITDALTQPVAGAPPGGMAAIVAAARARDTDDDTSNAEAPADVSQAAPEDAATPEPPAPLPPPAATPAINATPDGTVRTAQVPILMYHYLSTPPADANAYRLDLSVTPERFAAHLDAMQQAGYTTISLYTWLAHLTEGAPLPEKPVIITFDDGYRDNYENALPLLRARGMIATFFIVTDFIDDQRPEYLTWDMVREMYAAGMSIESHGRNHVSLANKDSDYLIWQALGSMETIQYELGVRPRFISYPAGEYDQATIDIFRSANYWAGFTTVQGATHSSDDLFRVRRVRVRGSTSPEELVRLLGLDW